MLLKGSATREYTKNDPKEELVKLWLIHMEISGKFLTFDLRFFPFVIYELVKCDMWT